MKRLASSALVLVLGLTLASGETYPSDGGWARLLGTSDNDSGFDIAVDSNGNSYITGRTRGDLDGKSNAGGYDIFVAKYDANGIKQWTRLLGTSETDSGQGIAVNSNGNSYITGYTYGDLDGKTNAGDRDIFVAKYDANGNRKWTRLLGTSSEDIGRGIALDSNRNSYVAGSTQGDLDGQSNAGGKDILVWKNRGRIVGAMPWLMLLLDED